MKKIYFVRHGESEGNAGPIRQIATTPLTEKGRMQAAFVSERCSRLPIEVVLCSTMARARETAQIILQKVSKPIEYSELFAERRRSSEVLGRQKTDPVSMGIEKVTRENFHRSGWRYSDEENFDDLKARALAVLAHLSGRPEEYILVVTHGMFMRVVVACAVFGAGLTGEACESFVRSFHMENTGITVLGHDPKVPDPWWLWVWNDHAHLSELEN